MSGLSAFGLGLSAARAIRNRTWARDRVFFEPTAAIEITAPTICVYAGRGRAELHDGDLLNGAADVRLRFEFWAPAQFQAAGLTFDLEASQALPFALFWRQVETVLLTDMTPWAGLWRQFRLRIHALDSQRDLFETDKGQKLVVEIIEMHIETIAEPAVGEPPCGVWDDLIAAMTADGQELAVLATVFAAELQGSRQPLPDWQVAMGLLGTTDDAVQSIGLGPLAETTPATIPGGDDVVETVTVPISPLP